MKEKRCKATVMMWYGEKSRCVKSESHKDEHYVGSAWSGFVWNDGNGKPRPSGED